MEALTTTLTDGQRLNALNLIYKKGLSTPKEELAFASEKLVYLKPFLNKLQNEIENSRTTISNLPTVRQVVDELLWDIWEEVEAACSRSTINRGERIAMEYGLQLVADSFKADFYYANKVA